MRFFLIALCILLLLACSGSASFAFNVTGRVVTDSKSPEPVDGVTVTVTNEGHIICETHTERDGGYAFKTDKDCVDMVYEHGHYAGKIITGLRILKDDFRIPDVSIVPLGKEVTAIGALPALRNEAEVYSVSAHGELLAEKLELIERQAAGEYRQFLNTVSTTGASDITTLVKKAVSCGNLRIMELLISQGMDANLRDSEGNTPLHLAVHRGNEELVKLFIAKAAGINAKDLRGRTPLHIASEKKNKEMILLLLEKGAYPFEMDNMGVMPLANSTIESAPGKDRFFRVQEGCALPVSSLTFSPSGRFLVTGSEDGIIRIWSPSSGRLMGDLITDRGTITSLSFSPGGSCLASGSGDGTVMLWDWKDEKMHEQTLSCSSPVRSLCFSGEGKYLLSGCDDGTVRIWNAITKEIIKTYTVHSKPITALLISPDNKYIVTSSDDGTLKFIDFYGVKMPEVLYRHSHSISTFCFSPKGTIVASGDETGEILLTDIFSGHVISRIKGHEGKVTGLLYSPGGRYLVSSGRDGIINYWDTLSWKKSLTVCSGIAAIRAIKFSPGGRYLVSGSEDGTITIFDSVSGNVLATLVGFKDREWISLTPDLYFASSLDGAHHILLQSKGEYVTLDQYWTPRRSSKTVKDCILGTMLPGKALHLPAPPQIRIISPAPGARSESGKVILKTEVKGDCRIKELLVLVNGRPVRNEAVNETTVEDSDTGKARELSTEVKLQLGLNKIEVVALSNDEVKSLPESVVVQYKYPYAVPSKKLFLLTVGVNNYGDRKLNLDCAALDAREIEEFFKRMKGLLFEEVRTFAFLDSAASSQSIINAIKEIGRESTDNDLVILFLAGHGVKNEHDEFFFLCHGGKRDELPANALSWNDFQQALLSLNAKNVLLLMDACHSGSIFRSDEEFVSHDNLAEGMIGVAVFAACRGNESSSEFPRLGGVFTQSLLSGLQGKALPADSKDGRITLFQTERYVSELVPRITGNRQHPVILRKERVVDIPLSILKVTQ